SSCRTCWKRSPGGWQERPGKRRRKAARTQGAPPKSTISQAAVPERGSPEESDIFNLSPSPAPDAEPATAETPLPQGALALSLLQPEDGSPFGRRFPAQASAICILDAANRATGERQRAGQRLPLAAQGTPRSS